MAFLLQLHVGQRLLRPSHWLRQLRPAGHVRWFVVHVVQLGWDWGGRPAGSAGCAAAAGVAAWSGRGLHGSHPGDWHGRHDCERSGRPHHAYGHGRPRRHLSHVVELQREHLGLADDDRLCVCPCPRYATVAARFTSAASVAAFAASVAHAASVVFALVPC